MERPSCSGGETYGLRGDLGRDVDEDQACGDVYGPQRVSEGGGCGDVSVVVER